MQSARSLPGNVCSMYQQPAMTTPQNDTIVVFVTAPMKRSKLNPYWLLATVNGLEVGSSDMDDAWANQTETTRTWFAETARTLRFLITSSRYSSLRTGCTTKTPHLRSSTSATLQLVKHRKIVCQRDLSLFSTYAATFNQPTIITPKGLFFPKLLLVTVLRNRAFHESSGEFLHFCA